VVMTSYRDPPPRLRLAIDSILSQTFTDFELIIAFEPDDANVNLVVESYQDPRLVILNNPKKMGMAASFNHCLDHARGRFIARMDSDDRAYPDRIEKELSFLTQRPDVDIVGGGVVIISDDGRQIGKRIFPLEHDEIVRRFAFCTPISHPTIMWDSQKVGKDLRYDVNFSVEDVELWMRLLMQGRRFANMPEYLIEYKQTDDWRRPLRHWHGHARVRLVYWRLALRKPPLFLGLLVFCTLAIMPRFVINALTQRSRFSDFVRDIRPIRGLTNR
jgi:glycosyltransferase involved in cell wall biosynthesis